jgi:heme oxygenase
MRDAPTFCSTIKDGTAAAHRRAESSAFVRGLLAGQLNVRSLVRLLESLLPVYEQLEAQLRASGDSHVLLFDDRRLDRSARLRRDLEGLGRRGGHRPTGAVEQYVRIVEDSACSPVRLLAHHYTRYLGDLAGGQAIAALVSRHYGVDRRALTYYDFAELGDLVRYRARYRALLDLLPWTPVEQAEFITECVVAFEANARLFAELAVDVGMLPTRAQPAGGFIARERAHVRAGREPSRQS